MKGRSQANAVAQQVLIAHWQSIVKSLNYYLKIMKANHVSVTVRNIRSKTDCFSSYNSTSFVGYCDCTGSAIPSPQGVHSDIFIHQCSVIQQVSALKHGFFLMIPIALIM